mgnify:FL=1|jgi:DNA repair exonuclease SbcCD ATPase subunit
MSDNERNNKYQPVGPFEFIFAETWKLLSSSEEQDYREATDGGTNVATDGGTVIQQEEKREKDQKEILQQADEVRAEMRKAEQKSGNSKFGELEDEVRQKMGEIEKIVKKNEEEFENVHSDVIHAEVSAENLSEVDNEIQQMVSNTQNEFGKVERLASQSLEELEQVRKETGGDKLLVDAEQRIQKIEELAQQVPKLEDVELKEGEEALEDEADFEQRFQRHEKLMYKVIRKSKDGKDPVKIQEEVFSDLNSEEIKQLDKDLKFMIEEAEKIKQESEREPQEVEKHLTEDEEVLKLLKDYVNRHDN